MELFVKTSSFIIFSVIIFLSGKFIEVTYLINGLIDWSSNDVHDFPLYDYIIGKKIIFKKLIKKHKNINDFQ